MDIAGTQYDVATAQWGDEWCMPNKAHMSQLKNMTSEWTTLNGVPGRKFIGKNGGSIFMPAAGSRGGSDESRGCYWSSGSADSDKGAAHALFFADRYVDRNNTGRFFGFPVRPIAKK